MHAWTPRSLLLIAILILSCNETGGGTGFSPSFGGNDPANRQDVWERYPYEEEENLGIYCPITAGCIPGKEEFSLAAFIAGHTYEFPEADSSQTLTVHALTSFVAAPSQSGPRALLLVGLNSKHVTATVDVPIDLVAVVDCSWSMLGEKFDASIAGLQSVIQTLRPTDRIAIVGYGWVAKTFLPLTPVSESAVVSQAVMALKMTDGTDISAGLVEGYSNFASATTHTSWLVLMSDGLPTKGLITKDEFGLFVRGYTRQGIGTTAVGVGADTDDSLMSAIAAAGGGKYYFLSDPAGLGTVYQSEVTRVSRPLADKVSFAFSLTDRYVFQQLYGFALESTGSTYRYEIPRVFYALKSGGFIAEMEFRPGVDDAASWGDLEVGYTPLGTTEVTSQTVSFGLPFNPASAPQNEYYSHHTARKAYVVLSAGLAIQEAGRLVWEMHNLTAADTYLTTALAEFDRRNAPLAGDAELIYARLLLVTLQNNIRAELAKMTTGSAPRALRGFFALPAAPPSPRPL